MEPGAVPAKPVKVSAFIKALRWCLLTYGIFYGQFQWERYHRRQKYIRDEHEKIRPTLEKQRKAELLAMKTDEYKKIASELGVELPPDWTAEGF